MSRMCCCMCQWKLKERNDNANIVSINLMRGQTVIQMLHTITFTQTQPIVSELKHCVCLFCFNLFSFFLSQSALPCPALPLVSTWPILVLDSVLSWCHHPLVLVVSWSRYKRSWRHHWSFHSFIFYYLNKPRGVKEYWGNNAHKCEGKTKWCIRVSGFLWK